MHIICSICDENAKDTLEIPLAFGLRKRAGLDDCLDFGENTPTTICAGQNYCLNAYGKGEGGYAVEYHGCGHGPPTALNVGFTEGAFSKRTYTCCSRKG